MKNQKTVTFISLIVIAVIIAQLMLLSLPFTNYAPSITDSQVLAIYMDQILFCSCTTIFLQLVIFLLLKFSLSKKDVS